MRVALYARVSTEDQYLHGLSIEAQLAALRDWAKDKTVVDEYVDAGISAKTPIKKRPELQRLLRDVSIGKIDVVAFTKLDRWTRNVREYYKAQDVLDANNVAWKAIHEDYETQTASGKLKVHIMLAVAQDEAERTGERVKAVFEEKRKKGLIVNGRVPPGFDYNNGHIEPNDDAPKIKALFDYYAATRSLHTAAYEAKQIIGRGYSIGGIKKLLENEKYRGAIVPPEKFDAVQHILSTRATRRVRTDRVYLFTGIVKCPVCGSKLTVRCREYKGTDYIYYRCDRHDKGRRCGYNGSVKERELESYLLARILPMIAEYNLTIVQKKKKPVDIPSLQRKIDKLTDLYIDDIISKEEYEKRSSPIRDAIKMAQTEDKPIDTSEIVSALDVYPSLSKVAQKAFWSVLVRSVTPQDDGFNVVFF